MSIEDIFVEKGRRRAQLEEFLMENLKGAGYGGADVRRTPTGTRITLYVERPGVAIGRSGRAIHDLTDQLADKLGIENPQIEVSEIDTPEFNASVMAERVAFLLSRGIYFRRAGYSTLRRIMDAGARGAEIVISGKLTGNYAREERFYDGYLKKAGERASRLVSTGHAVAKLPVGTIGVKVRIMPPGISILDESGILKEELEEAVEESGEEIEEKSKVDTEAKE